MSIRPGGGSGGSAASVPAACPIGWAQLELAPLPATNAGATMNFPVLADTAVVSDGNIMVTLSGGPYTFGAAGEVGAALLGVDLLTRVLGFEYAEMSVSNGAGTEKLVLGTAGGGTVGTGPTSGNINQPFDFSSEVESIGTDLNEVDGKVVSTAGGQFFVSVTVFTTSTDLVLVDQI